LTPTFPDQLSLRVGPVTAVDLALFAASSGDHNPLHLDAGVARSAGFDRPVVHGMFTMACVARLFSSQFGPTRLQALQTRFSGVALLGDVLGIEAFLTEVRDGCGHYGLTARTASGSEIVQGSARVGSGSSGPAA
jgi:acyl dehydratase